ncbi:MAG: arylamine N-acetyltransferase [Gammaproteobacteria bacterium]|jgi:N-hydroxyarylamine O-acetyltransferase|nr:arylamine N-acetyltransferase [Gammaproteobacteria bacterium]
MLTAKQLKKYFTRIGQSALYDSLLSGESELSFATLRKIQMSHVFTFPFENLDMHNVLNRPDERASSIDIDDIFKKMVTGARGGYCFETNELIRQVLLSLGFDVKTFNAGVMWLKSQKLAPCHEMLIVRIGSCEYLIEPGFGAPGPIEPLLFKVDGKLYEVEQYFPQHEVKKFRFIKDDDGDFQLQGQVTTDWQPESPWKPLYAFKTAVECTPEDFARGHHFVTVSEQSPFLQRLFVTLPIKVDEDITGRITLLPNLYKISRPEGVTELPVTSQDHFMEILKMVFDMTLPPDSNLTAKQVRFPVPALQERSGRPEPQDRTSEPLQTDPDLHEKLASLLTANNPIALAKVEEQQSTKPAPVLMSAFKLHATQSTPLLPPAAVVSAPTTTEPTPEITPRAALPNYKNTVL